MNQTIICPSCSKEIPLTETLFSQVEGELKNKLDLEYSKKDELLQQKIKESESLNLKLQEKEKSIEQQISERLESEKTKLWKVAQEKAKEKVQSEFSTKLIDLENQNNEKENKLKKLQQNELELLKQARELEEQKDNLALELQRKLNEERQKIIEKTKSDVLEENRMKILEKDKQLEQMSKTIEDLKRQSEQGSMQIQGDAQEEDLKQILKNSFPSDLIEDVPTGIRGADLIHTVNSNFGEMCGIILWESKNTKSWNNEWIKKLKIDQSNTSADICILVTKSLPEGLTNFGSINGVWVVEYKYALAVSNILRQKLVEISQVKKTMAGKEQKMEYLYNYLSGAQFKNRVENIVLAFTSLKIELDKEKRAMQTIWSRREKEIERVISNTTGFYGDLQGIIGSSLQTIPSLELETGIEIEHEIEHKIESEIESSIEHTTHKEDRGSQSNQSNEIF